MSKRNLLAIAVTGLTLFFTNGVFGQTGGESRKRKIQEPTVTENITVPDNEAQPSLKEAAQGTRRNPLAGRRSSPTAPNGTQPVNNPLYEDENRDGDFDDRGEARVMGPTGPTRNPKTTNAPVQNGAYRRGDRNRTGTNTRKKQRDAVFIGGGAATGARTRRNIIGGGLGTGARRN